MSFPALHDSNWRVVLEASAMAAGLERDGRFSAFGLDEDAHLRPVPADHAGAVLEWRPGSGWRSRLASEDPGYASVDLYLPMCSATPARPMTVGHLGQSLDGFIATHSGDSQFVTGQANILHLHRMRALCDAVVVGAGTVAADDPQLTTRHVAGPSPLRVVFDLARRLAQTYRVFNDDAAPTLYLCARSLVHPGETQMGCASILGLDGDSPGGGVGQVLTILRERGCSRIFVEGGGVTVSAFLEANLLDRLQVAVAPLFIGDGRPAIRLASQANLRDCRRPRYRVFRMGGDVLFDCELNAQVDPAESAAADALPVARII